MEDSDDQSLFAWGYGKPVNELLDRPGELFARSSEDFSNAGKIVTESSEHHYAMTNKGLLVNLRLTNFLQSEWSFTAPLNCYDLAAGYEHPIGLPLGREGATFLRDTTQPMGPIRHHDRQYLFRSGEHRDINREPSHFTFIKPEMLPSFSIAQHGLDLRAFITECYPRRWMSALRESENGRVHWMPAVSPSSDAILFRYGGRQIPSLIAKLRYQFERGIGIITRPAFEGFLSPQHMTCSLAWFPVLCWHSDFGEFDCTSSGTSKNS